MMAAFGKYPHALSGPVSSAAVYNGTAGWTGTTETGRNAALEITEKLGRLQKITEDFFDARGAEGGTAEEASDELEQPRTTIQPRISELRAKGILVASEMRRTNASSGKSATVWVHIKHVEASK